MVDIFQLADTRIQNRGSNCTFLSGAAETGALECLVAVLCGYDAWKTCSSQQLMETSEEGIMSVKKDIVFMYRIYYTNTDYNCIYVIVFVKSCLI